MKAAVIERFGAPEVLVLRDLPTPVPGEGEIVVRVRSIGLNFAEVFARLGIYPGIPDPPFVPGIEFSGVVAETGKKVTGIRKGSRVFGFSRQGAYAEYVKTRADHVVPIPSTMSFRRAAAFSVASLSAYHALVTLAHIRKSEKLLLHAAAGGVGIAAIQLAKHLGAEVYATAGSAEKVAMALRQGADHSVNYRTQDFAAFVRRETGGYGVDVVLDSVGGSVFRKGWKLMAPMGRYVLYGFASVTSQGALNRIKMLTEAARVPLLYPPNFVSKNISLMGFNLYFLSHKTEYLKQARKALLRLYQRKVLRPHIGTVFPFDDIVKAHKFLQSRKSIGKVVVDL